ncbi:MAG: hypothetical protein M3P08_05180 [Thermoproteota archaeon]|nr:hypothetical protein [Thermoproteota archaeon]
MKAKLFYLGNFDSDCDRKKVVYLVVFEPIQSNFDKDKGVIKIGTAVQCTAPLELL